LITSRRGGARDERGECREREPLHTRPRSRTTEALLKGRRASLLGAAEDLHVVAAVAVRGGDADAVAAVLRRAVAAGRGRAAAPEIARQLRAALGERDVQVVHAVAADHDDRVALARHEIDVVRGGRALTAEVALLRAEARVRREALDAQQRGDLAQPDPRQ